MKISYKETDTLTAMFKAAIETVGYTKVIVALHNACVHGDVFGEDNISEDDLSSMFDNYDNLISIGKRIS